MSKPQKALLELLREYGILRIDQMEKLLKCGGTHISNLEPLVRQLVYGGEITRQDNLLCALHGKKQNIMESVDIMLCLSPTEIQMHKSGKWPAALTFFKMRDDKLYRYDICPVPAGQETMIASALEGTNHKYRILVFYLQDLRQREFLQMDCEIYFAIKDQTTYRFYK